MSRDTQRQAGFSLIELMIAMTVTLIISGGVFALLASGQSAFRIQPELTDRQQNIRSALDRIMRDVHNAGVGTPPFTQVFTTGLNGAGLASPTGGDSDILEFITNDSGWDPEPLCTFTPTYPISDSVRLARSLTRPDGTSKIKTGTRVMLLMLDTGGQPSGQYSIREVTGLVADTSAAGPNCLAGSRHDRLVMARNAVNPDDFCPTNGLGQGNIAAGPCAPYAVLFMNMVQYRIQNDDTGVPCLVRYSSSDGPAPVFIARGIEDMQVTYRSTGVLSDSSQPPVPDPELVVKDNFDTLTAEVEVTLTARAADLKPGANDPLVTGTGAARGIRGALTSRGAVRQALVNLYADTTPPRPKWQ